MRRGLRHPSPTHVLEYQLVWVVFLAVGFSLFLRSRAISKERLVDVLGYAVAIKPRRLAYYWAR
jgi:hypothetical protein